MRSLPAAAATLVCLLSSLAPLVSGQQATASTCQDVQIFIAVGHGESFPGNQRSIAQGVCKGLSSCAYSNIDYPSTDETKGYCVNSVTGINSGFKTVTAYVQKCPTSKVVLTGWSQGGQLVTDMISGGGGSTAGRVWPQDIAKSCVQADTPAMAPTWVPGGNGESVLAV